MCDADRQMLERVADAIGWDTWHEVPAHVLARARTLADRLPARTPGVWRRIAAAVRFDSLAAPAPAGVRSGAGGVRQMVFEAERYRVDLQWELTAPGGPVSLVGRIGTDVETPLPAGTVVRAVSSATVVGETLTNRFGEFVLECAWSRPLTLLVAVAYDGVEIAIPLGHVAWTGRPAKSTRRSR